MAALFVDFDDLGEGDCFRDSDDGDLIGDRDIKNGETITPSDPYTHLKNESYTLEPLLKNYKYQIRLPGIGFLGYMTSSIRDRCVESFISIGHEVQEVIRGSYPMLVNIDIDYSFNALRKVEHANIDLVVQAFISEAIALGVKDPRYDIVESKRAEKLSWHLIGTNFLICDGRANKEFNRRVKDRLVLHPIGSDGSIDCRGTLSTFNLRVPFCSKQSNLKPIPDSILTPVDGIERVGRDTVGGWFIQSDKYDSLPVYGTPSEKIEPVAILEGSELSNIIKKVKEDFPDLFHLTLAKGKFLAAFAGVRGSSCSVCNKVHEESRFILVQAENGAIYLKCAASGFGGRYLEKYKKADKPNTGLTEIRTIAADRYNGLANPEASTINARYNSEVIVDNGKSDYYIRSAWGTGKSVHISNVVSQLLKVKPQAKILIPSARKSLSSQLLSSIPGAVSYAKIVGPINLIEHPIVVVQYESIKRIPQEAFNGVDLLIIDEPLQLFAHAESGQFNITTSVKLMVSKAKRIIVTDNDLSDYVVDLFSSVRTNPKIVINNVYNKYENVIVDIFQGIAKTDTLKIIAIDRLTEQKKKKDSGDDSWEGTVFPIHNKTEATAFYKKVLPVLGDDVVLYTGDTDNTKKHVDFSDASAAWADKVAVIYTSTVSVGVSCDIPRITECFAFFDNNNISATQSSQMLMRCRQLKKIHIGYKQSRFSPIRFPTDLTGLCNYMVEAINREKIPDMFRDDRNPYVLTNTTTNPADLEAALNSFEGRVFTTTSIDKYRSMADFLGYLTSILRRSGLTVVVNTNEPIKTEKELKQIKNEMKILSSQVNREAAQRIAENTASATEYIRLSQINGGAGDKPVDASAELNAGFTGHFITMAYDLPDYTELSADWVEYYKPLTETYKNIKDCVNNQVGVSCTINTLEIRKAVSTTNEKHSLIKQTFDILKIDPKNSKVQSVAAADVSNSIHLAKIITSESYRVFKKAVYLGTEIKQSKPKTIITALNYALEEYGAKLHPIYKNKTAEIRGVASSYELHWIWGNPAIVPIIEHPSIKFLEKNEQRESGLNEVSDSLRPHEQ